jgi:carboxymethylenebutenolidase
MATKGTMIKMKMSDGAEIGVYHVEPTGKRRGGLVLIQEIFGLTEHIKECCDRFAAEGYEVLGPAVYDREAPGFEASYSPEDIQKAIKIARGEHPFDLSVKDSQTCIDALKDKGPVYITGYCYGGSVTWAAACQCSGLAAASGYYGGNIVQMIDQQPKCPTILHFGKHDHGIPMEAVDKIKAAHPEVAVYVYDAGHGFNSDRRTDYNPEAAKLAMQRTLELFRGNGG